MTRSRLAHRCFEWVDHQQPLMQPIRTLSPSLATASPEISAPPVFAQGPGAFRPGWRRRRPQGQAIAAAASGSNRSSWHHGHSLFLACVAPPPKKPELLSPTAGGQTTTAIASELQLRRSGRQSNTQSRGRGERNGISLRYRCLAGPIGRWLLHRQPSHQIIHQGSHAWLRQGQSRG